MPGEILRHAFCLPEKKGFLPGILSRDKLVKEKSGGLLIIMKEQRKKHLFTNRQLAALLIPLALDQLLNSFMGTVDTLIVSNIGSAAISAVSLVDAINILIVEAFFALAAGGTVICFAVSWEQRRGKGK